MEEKENGEVSFFLEKESRYEVDMFFIHLTEIYNSYFLSIYPSGV